MTEIIPIAPIDGGYYWARHTLRGGDPIPVWVYDGGQHVLPLTGTWEDLVGGEWQIVSGRILPNSYDTLREENQRLRESAQAALAWLQARHGEIAYVYSPVAAKSLEKQSAALIEQLRRVLEQE